MATRTGPCRRPTPPAASRSGATAVWRCGARRWRHSHQTSRPNDSASRASAAARAARVSVSGRTPAAAIVSTTPCVAATTLRQSRRGSGARIHSTSHPADQERVACQRRSGAPTPRPWRRRRRPGRGSGTRRPRRPSARPGFDAVPVRRATYPSTKSSASATAASATSVATCADLLERVRGQRRDADGQRRPHERHPPGRADPLRAVAEQAAGQRGVHDHAAGELRPATRRDRGRPSPRAPRAAAPGRPARSPGHPEPTAACLGTRTYERKVPWMG